MASINTGKHHVEITEAGQRACAAFMMGHGQGVRVTFDVLPWGFQIILSKKHPIIAARVVLDALEPGSDPIEALWNEAADWMRKPANARGLEHGF